MLNLLLLAESAGLDVPGIGAGVLSLTGSGFAVWYGVQTATKTIPGIVKDFREEMAKEREFHQAQVDKLLAKVESGSCRHPTTS